MIANSRFMTLKNKRGGRGGQMALKLNVAKAYDHVEWGYLERVMLHMGFDTKWVNWVLNCVSTVTNSVNIKGQQHGLSSPKEFSDRATPFRHIFFSSA